MAPSSRNRVSSPAPKPVPKAVAERAKAAGMAQTSKSQDSGANFSTPMGADSFFPAFAVLVLPALCNVLTFISADPRLESPSLSGFAKYCKEVDWLPVLPLASDHSQKGCLVSAVLTPSPFTPRPWVFLFIFMLIGRILCDIPGDIKEGPSTATGHVPQYVDNGMTHCLLFSGLFAFGSNLAPSCLGYYDFGIIYDVFVPLVGVLNVFGLAFCFLLYLKGLYFPSTKDCGSTGRFLLDYYWGTELYPKLLGVDVKRFINCRFSMTFWMISGLSYAYRSYTLHGEVDYGLLLSAISQYLYLLKFFAWEIGYMRSIDIIVDRAGFYEEWGCLVFVPTLYTLHTRLLVRSPSQLSLPVAVVIFSIGLAGVAVNFWADKQREWFREADGKLKIWGKAPKFVEAKYTVVEDNGSKTVKRSLLLASGFWGVARHFHYVFELTAAWSWCLLANPFVNGVLPLAYSTFLTILLFDRAKRDEEKCLKKYGEDYKTYSKLVPYLIVPGVY